MRITMNIDEKIARINELYHKSQKEGLTEEERRILAIEYFSDTTGEVSNAFKCRRSRLRRKIEESLGIFRKKRR